MDHKQFEEWVSGMDRYSAATGTPLSGLHGKDKWLAFGACIADGLAVRVSAQRCRFSVNTAFRRRHRFLTAEEPNRCRLAGIVEANEAHVPESRKDERNLERRARRRGGKASKCELSDEQVPVLVAADRSGTMASAVLPATVLRYYNQISRQLSAMVPAH